MTKYFPIVHKLSRVGGSFSSRRMHVLARKSIALLLSAVIATQPLLLQAAELSVDVNAAAANQPGIAKASNNVPVVNIAGPNEAGLSHNKLANEETPGIGHNDGPPLDDDASTDGNSENPEPRRPHPSAYILPGMGAFEVVKALVEGKQGKKAAIAAVYQE